MRSRLRKPPQGAFSIPDRPSGSAEQPTWNPLAIAGALLLLAGIAPAARPPLPAPAALTETTS